MCSVQSKTTTQCLSQTPHVTSIHPLFGPRTPRDKRYSILTHSCGSETEKVFLAIWGLCSNIRENGPDGKPITPETHDIMMAKTHVAAILAAKQLKVFVDRAADIPDELIPNSFRLMRQFVQTMEDTPAGTVSSILSNPYA